MDFKLTPREEAFRDEVRRFLDENLEPDTARDFAKAAEFQRKVCERSWVGF